jgi:hypothetical protein
LVEKDIKETTPQPPLSKEGTEEEVYNLNKEYSGSFRES